MQDRFQEVCNQILLYRDHRDAGVRRAVIELIPTLASYNDIEFTAHYLHKTMLYLLGQLKRERDRTTGGVELLLHSTTIANLFALL